MTTQYNINADTRGVNGFGLPFCDTVYSAKLAATTNTTLIVPGTLSLGMAPASQTNRFVAVFSYDPSASVFVAVNGTAAIPAGAGFAATTSELNPTAKKVKAGDTLNFFSSGTPNVTVAFYSVQEG